MAGEQKGKAYEAFTKAALEALRKKGVFKGEIFWDEKAEGMTIVPDLTIGPDKDHPHTVILITHCGSAKNSDMKYWRNMGELAEIKILLPVVPKVFNLVFDSVIKENLKQAQAASFDGQLLVGDLRYGSELQEWIDENLGRFPKDKNEKVDFLTQEAKTAKELRRILGAFSSDLEALLKKKAPPELEQVWAMERKRAPGRAPRARDTFVRRGLSKLLVFEDKDVALRLFSGERVKPHELPLYAFELGLVSKAVGRADPADEEIKNAVETLGVKLVRKLLNLAPVKQMAGWFTTLRNLSHLIVMGTYVADNFESLLSSKSLKAQCLQLHADPAALIDNISGLNSWPPTNVWLIEIILELIKSRSGNAAGYGYAQMAREVASISGMPHAGDRVHSIVLSDWIHRRGKETMPDKVLEGICRVLALRLSQISHSGVVSALVSIKESVRQNILEAKVCTYRGFEPLRYLIEIAVPNAQRMKIKSCFGERALLDKQSTNTTVLMASRTLINWQSASDAGRDHKKKELCGRAVAMRYSWDSKNKIFIPRPGVEKLILVVDGTWRRADLLALARAGWDEIFYPDEMDKLAEAIV